MMNVLNFYESHQKNPYERIVQFVELDGLIKLVAEKPNPIDRIFGDFSMPRRLVTEEGVSPVIITAYTTARFQIPTAQEETNNQFRTRIEKRSMEAVNYVRRHSKGEVNAFHIGNLGLDYMMLEETNHSAENPESDSLDKISKDLLIQRIVFDLSLFQVDGNMAEEVMSVNRYKPPKYAFQARALEFVA